MVLLCRLRRRLAPLGACIHFGDSLPIHGRDNQSQICVVIISRLPDRSLLSDLKPVLIVVDRPERFYCEHFVEALTPMKEVSDCRRIALMDGSAGLLAIDQLAFVLGASGRVWIYDDRYRVPATRRQTMIQLEIGDDIVATAAETVRKRLVLGRAVFAFVPSEEIMQQVEFDVGWDQSALGNDDCFADLEPFGRMLHMSTSIDFVWRDGSDFSECVAIFVLKKETELPHQLAVRQTLGRVEELVVIGTAGTCAIISALLSEPFEWREDAPSRLAC